VCDAGAVDMLTRFARAAAAPAGDAEVQIGAAAIEALGLLHPPDLAQRLAPFRDKNVPPQARLLAARALARPSVCR
jgi:hypothetical protein